MWSISLRDSINRHLKQEQNQINIVLFYFILLYLFIYFILFFFSFLTQLLTRLVQLVFPRLVLLLYDFVFNICIFFFLSHSNNNGKKKTTKFTRWHLDKCVGHLTTTNDMNKKKPQNKYVFVRSNTKTKLEIKTKWHWFFVLFSWLMAMFVLVSYRIWRNFSFFVVVV